MGKERIYGTIFSAPDGLLAGRGRLVGVPECGTGSFIDVHVSSFIAASGVDYHDSRNSGLLDAPAYSLSVGLLLLVPHTFIAAALAWKKNGRGRDNGA